MAASILPLWSAELRNDFCKSSHDAFKLPLNWLQFDVGKQPGPSSVILGDKSFSPMPTHWNVWRHVAATSSQTRHWKPAGTVKAPWDTSLDEMPALSLPQESIWETVVGRVRKRIRRMQHSDPIIARTGNFRGVEDWMGMGRLDAEATETRTSRCEEVAGVSIVCM